METLILRARSGISWGPGLYRQRTLRGERGTPSAFMEAERETGQALSSLRAY